MKEESKDAIEDIAAAALEAAVSLIPIVGAPAAVAINRVAGSARQRRLESIVDQLKVDLTKSIEAGWNGDPAKLLSSDQALAALETFIRASAETSSKQKLKLLRKAFIAGTATGWRGMDRAYLRLVERIAPQQVQILRRLDGQKTTYIRRQIEERFFGKETEGHDERLLFPLWWEELVGWGLVGEVEETVVVSHGNAATETRAGLSQLGAGFLAFLGFEDPPDERFTDEVLYPEGIPEK